MFPINARHNLRRSSGQINTAGIAPHDRDESNNGDVDAINVAGTHRGAHGGGSGRVPVPTAVQIFNVVVELAGQAEPMDLAGSIETTEKMPSIPPPKSNSRNISSTKQWRQYRPAHSTDLLRPLRLDIVTVSQGHDGHDGHDANDENDDAIRHSAAATSTHSRDTTCRYSSCCASPSINPAWEHINERMDLPDDWWAGEAGEDLYKSMRLRVKVMANLKSRLDQEDQISCAKRNSDASADVDTDAREKGQLPIFDLLDIPIHPSFLKTLDEMPESFPPNACIIHFTDRSMRCVPSLYHLLVDESVTGGDNSSSGDGAATDDVLRFEDDAFRTLDDVVKDEKAPGEDVDVDAGLHAEAQSGATDPNREEDTTALSTAGDGTNTAGNGGGDNRKHEHEHGKDQEEIDHHRQQRHHRQQQQNATTSRSQPQTHDGSFTPQPSSNPTSTLDQRARIHSADAMLDAAIADANEDEAALMAAIAEEEAAIAKHLISIQSKKQSVQTLVANISRTGKESTVVKREAEQHARMLGRDRVRCRSLRMKLLSDLQSIYPIRCAVGVCSQLSMNAKQRQADAVGTESGTLIPGGPNHASRSRSASGDVAVNVGVDVDGHQHTSSAANAESVDVHRMNMNMNTSMNTDGNASAGAAYTSVPKAANTVSDASMTQSGSERMPVSPVAASRSGASTSMSTKRNLHNDFIDGGNDTSANASIGKTVNHEAHARDGQLASHHHHYNDHVHIHTSTNESGAYIIPTIRGLRTPPRSNHAAVANSGRAAYSHSTGAIDNAQTLGQMSPPPSSAAAAVAAATKKAATTTKTGAKSTATSTASTAAASTPISDEEASAALGFTCHAILLVSKYLSVPLRHRIIHNSSRSGIMVDKGTMLPLFVARSVNRDELDEALSLLHSNVDTIASSRGIHVFGDWHILEKLNVIVGHELRML